jgi:short-subunit dehydrogenase
MKTALIIGVGPGLGLALAKKFFLQDFKVVMVARSLEKLEDYSKNISGSGNGIACYQADVGNRESIGSAIDKILLERGTPDVTIYNVSILRPASPAKIDYTTFIEDFNVNVGGALITYQKIRPVLLEKGSGMLLFTGGGLSLSPFHEFASLGVGKAGLRNLVISMAQENETTGIKIYTITINGMIEKGTFFDPEKIAENFYEVYDKGLPDGNTELIYHQ